MISLPPSLFRQASSPRRPDGAPKLLFQGASSAPKKSSPPQDTFQSSRGDEPHEGSRATSPAPDRESLDNAACDRDNDSLSRFLQTMGYLPPQLGHGNNKAAGLNPNFSNEFGDTLLMLAAGMGNAEVTRQLVALGGQVNAQNASFKNYTPLIMAVLAKAPDCVEALMQSPELDLNLADTEGNPPLAYAVVVNQPEIVDILLQKGANPNQANYDGLTPLAQACGLESLSILEKLLAAKADPNRVDLDGDTPLLIATARGNHKMVEALLKAKANPNHWNDFGMGPLGFAMIQQNESLARLLLEHGAQPDAMSNLGHTLLTELCRMDVPEAVALSLSLGVDVNQPDFYGVTPLKQAILHNQPRVVAKLLAAPDLTERSDIERGWQALKGQDALSEQACEALSSYLTAPFFVNPLRENPGLNLGPLFSRFARVSHNFRTNPQLMAFRQQSPEGYRQYCAQYLIDLMHPPDADEHETAESSSGHFQGPLPPTTPTTPTAQAESRQTLPRMVAGTHALQTPLNSRRIRENLERRLSELKQERPAYWRQMRADELYRLFNNHEAIQAARQDHPQDYLLASKAFLGLMMHCFAEMDENPLLTRRLTPKSYQRFFRAELTHMLNKKQLHPLLSDFELHSLLTLP
ncbi:ankyrin repeat domain-containing protein [Vampirovibrio chlorellavorus]|uniref:ankyrin repeat domain-containing protein n=1 Tax=Vampirovibrio chlorellavorus TaxID=758823 RepID=UPI0026F0E760|nr:ankyrin repeat domain-containing protein [Vampirovibrio chlorellavorus]